LAGAADTLRDAPGDRVDVGTDRNGHDQQRTSTPVAGIHRRGEMGVGEFEDPPLCPHRVEVAAHEGVCARDAIRHPDDHHPASGIGQTGRRLREALKSLGDRSALGLELERVRLQGVRHGALGDRGQSPTHHGLITVVSLQVFSPLHE